MRRAAGNLACLVSFVACICLSVLWVRGHWIEDKAFARYDVYSIAGASFRGELGVEFGTVSRAGPADLYTPTWVASYRSVDVRSVPESDVIHIAEAEGRFGHMPHYHSFLGFRYHPRMRDGLYTYRGVAVPTGFLAMLTAMLPIRRILTELQRRDGFCVHCGYDLRATPDRCPECGAVPRRLRGR